MSNNLILTKTLTDILALLDKGKDPRALLRKAIEMSKYQEQELAVHRSYENGVQKAKSLEEQATKYIDEFGKVIRPDFQRKNK